MRWFVWCIGFLISACQISKDLSLEKRLNSILECKDLTLFLDSTHKDAYQKTTEEYADWEETQAFLLYHKTQGTQCYLYSLSYTTKDSQKKDIGDQTIRHITHLLKTEKIFPKSQEFKIRYATKEPLLFEWVESITVCKEIKKQKK